MTQHSEIIDLSFLMEMFLNVCPSCAGEANLWQRYLEVLFIENYEMSAFITAGLKLEERHGKEVKEKGFKCAKLFLEILIDESANEYKESIERILHAEPKI